MVPAESSVATGMVIATRAVRDEGLSRSRIEVSILAVATLVAAVFRLYGITDRSVWYDEAFVVSLAQMSIPDMFRALVELDPHPPLYYLLMHFWVSLGTEPLAVRLPSALLSSLSVPLLYVVGRRVASRRVALGAVAILAVSPFHIDWAQQARMYSLLGVLCLGSTYYLLKGLQEGGRASWVLHSLLSAAALYTQINALFYLAAQGIAVLILCARRRRLWDVAGAAWVKSQAVAVLLFLPWLPAFVMQNVTYGDPRHAWTSIRGLEALLFDFGFGYLPYWHAPLGLAVTARDAMVLSCVAVALIGAWSLRDGVGGVLLSMLFLGTVALLALVGIWRGIFLAKTVLGASFAFYLLLAAGIEWVGMWSARRGQALLVAGVALVVALNLVGLARYYGVGPQESWQEAAAYLEQQARPGEVVLVDSSTGLMPLNYYLKLDGHPIETHGVPFRPWAVTPPPLTEQDFRQVEAIVENKAAVWLVVHRVGFPDPDGELLPFLASRYGLADARLLTRVRLFKFVPGRPSSAATPPGEVSQSRSPAVLAGEPSTGGSAGVYFGAWVGDRVNVPGDVSRFEEAIGKRLAIVHRYSDNPPHRGQRFDSEWAASVREAGSIPMLSWQPGFGYGTRSLSQVAQGERDDYVASWADQLREWGHPIFLRMMWEQNSSWFGWRAYQEPQTSEFVAAWRHVVDVFRSRGASNVTFVWSPHVSGNGASQIMPTYPGDDYVDWVALDGYPYRGGRGDFAETFGPDYDLLATSLDKPIMIAETSLESWSDEAKAEWIGDILGNQIPNRFPRVKALVWFEEKNTDGIHYSILEGQGPMSRDAFRREIASPYYASNHYGGLEASPIPPPDTVGVGAQVTEDGAQGMGAVAAGGEIPSAEGAPANLVVDPGFEIGGVDGGWNPAWVVPSWVSAVRRDGGATAHGGYSMLHSSGGGESYTVYQDLPVEAAASYDLSVALLVEEGLRYGKASLEVQFLNQYGGVIESRPVSDWREVTDGWTRIEGSVKAARGAARARIQIKVTSLRGAFRLDDFSFTRSMR